MSIFSIISPRRRWLRFSLRSMLVTLLAASAALGLWSRSALKQKKAVETLRAGGWLVMYDYDEDSLGTSKPGDCISALLGVDYVHTVTGVGEAIGSKLHGEQALAALKDLSRLRIIELTRTAPTDDDLRELGRCWSLQQLKIWNSSSITDAGVAHLSGLEKLQIALFANARFTGKALRPLGRLPRLTDLFLDQQIVDDGVSELANFRKLKTLWVFFKLDADIDSLKSRVRQVLPDCDVQMEMAIDWALMEEAF